jgi:hypothetical protein
VEFERLLDKERTGHELLGDDVDEPVTRERFIQSLGAASDVLKEG